jgi:hypothetical protein
VSSRTAKAKRRSAVPVLRRDGDPANAVRRRPAPAFSATGGDTGGRCATCGRPFGFVEGGMMMSATCNVCAGVSSGSGEDTRISTSLTGERMRTSLSGG